MPCHYQLHQPLSHCGAKKSHQDTNTGVLVVQLPIDHVACRCGKTGEKNHGRARRRCHPRMNTCHFFIRNRIQLTMTVPLQ